MIDFRVVFLLLGIKKVALAMCCLGQVCSGDVLFVCERDFFTLQLCNIRITKKPQYEAPVDETV